jgi:hypothetical protein
MSIQLAAVTTAHCSTKHIQIIACGTPTTGAHVNWEKFSRHFLRGRIAVRELANALHSIFFYKKPAVPVNTRFVLVVVIERFGSTCQIGKAFDLKHDV